MRDDEDVCPSAHGSVHEPKLHRIELRAAGVSGDEKQLEIGRPCCMHDASEARRQHLPRTLTCSSCQSENLCG